MRILRKGLIIVEIYRYEDGLSLEISHNGYQTTSIGNLDLEDLKKLRKVVRKAIRDENN